MRWVTPAEIVERLAGATAVASPGCGEPSTLLALIGEHADRLPGLRLYSGLLLGDYPFLDAVESGQIAYGTWHVMPAVRELVEAGTVPFYPVRASRVPWLLGALEMDTALIRVSPPDRHGFCSLGASVSYPRTAVELATTVIAEIDEAVPRTRGESEIHVDQIDLAIRSARPLPEYRRAPSSEVSEQIARHLLALLPERPTIQIGIGAIPEAFVDLLLAEGVAGLRFAGMATDGIADLFAAGLIDRGRGEYPPVMSAELMGTRTLMDFADDNPALGTYSTERGITASTLWGMDRFVSINSALAVDLTGQVSAEALGGKQVSGVGGSVDFFESAMHSEGGVRVIALPASDVRRGVSKIVPELGAGAQVSIPRHSVEWVVTEHGAVSLAALPLAERAEALLSIAPPAADPVRPAREEEAS
ncbi:acetyl-CoA hydrolase/transferase family protein [Nocardioides sp. GXZ039]|uniref:acetyl-CoA hydrolase/transferase family protein n=1 Tax=Nocardioides sp. GXZ039 TaxID=3136018 RepID=UPI0030F43DCC